MATFTATNNGYTLELVVTPGSQSITGNTTALTYTLTLKAGSRHYSDWPTGWEVLIDGKQVAYNSGAQKSIAQNGTLQLVSGPTTVTHAADGTKTNMAVTFRLWTSTSQYYLPGSISGSGTMTLTTIPRASSFTLSSEDVTIESSADKSITATITAASTAFSHKVKVVMENYSAEQTVATGTETATISLPRTMLNQIPDATSGTATVILTTYNGTTAIGTASKTITIRAGDSVVPTISAFTATRVAGQTAFNVYLKGYDKARLKTTAAGAYGSTIKTYSITGGLTGADVTTGVLTKKDTNTWTVTVTDSRGRTVTESVSVDVVDYSVPIISGATFERCNSAGSPDDDGTYLSAKAAVTISSVNSLNSYTAKVQYRLLGSYDVWADAGAYSSGETVLFNVLDDNSYEIRILVTDKLLSSFAVGTLDIGPVLIEYDLASESLLFRKAIDMVGNPIFGAALYGLESNYAPADASSVATPGIYRVSSDKITTNYPVNQEGIMVVFGCSVNQNTTSILWQIYVTFSGAIYSRIKWYNVNTGAGTGAGWFPWTKISAAAV